MKIEKGQKIPEFSFDTHVRDSVKISDAVKEQKYTVLWVLRYIGCPTCRLDVHVIGGRYQELADRGAKVYVVMQSDRAHVRADLEKTKEELPFEIVCDPGQAIYEMLSVEPGPEPDPDAPFAGMDEAVLAKIIAKVQTAEKLGFVHGDYEGNEQQLPAMFILDGEGVVKYAHYAADPADMPDLDAVLGLLDEI